MATHTPTTPPSANEASCVSPSARQFSKILAALQKLIGRDRLIEQLESGDEAEMHFWLIETDRTRDALTDALLDMHLILVCPAEDRPLHRMTLLIDEILCRPGTRATAALTARLRHAFEGDFLLAETSTRAANTNCLLKRARRLVLAMTGFDEPKRGAKIGGHLPPDAFRLFPAF